VRAIDSRLAGVGLMESLEAGAGRTDSRLAGVGATDARLAVVEFTLFSLGPGGVGAFPGGAGGFPSRRKRYVGCGKGRSREGTCIPSLG